MLELKLGFISMELELELELEDWSRKMNNNNIDPDLTAGGDESFPKMLLRVLLVEADDSTRRIIAALLRKCNYRVSSFSDGLKAWEFLKGKPHNVDLILTELDLPSISGYPLLTLLMEHHICKNIPVIMMSSRHTITMVLKCIFKGAADFLIKPIRKNELNNLWQHVWRRHLIAGKSSMHFTLGQPQPQPTSDNDVMSNYSSAYLASPNKIKECSERGSDAQSSCTTPDLEAESECMPNLQGLLPLKYGAAPNLNMDDKKHGLAAYVDKEICMLESNMKEMSDNAAKNEACDSMSSVMREDHDFVEIRNTSVVVRPESYRVNADSTREIDAYNNNESAEPSCGVIDLIGKFDDYQKCIERVSSYIDTSAIKSECSPQLELSLRRICPGKLKNQGNEKVHVLNHSNASAFSSYNSCKMMKPPSLMISNGPTKSEISGIESPRPLPSLLSGNSGSTSLEQCVSASNSRNNLSTKVTGAFDQAEHRLQQTQPGLLPVPDLTFEKAYAGHVSPSMFYAPSGLPRILNSRSACQQEQSSISVNDSFQKCYDISNSKHVYHQYEETTNKITDQVAEELKHDSPAIHNSSSSLCNGQDHINSNAYGSICKRTEVNTLSPVTAEKVAANENMNPANNFTHEGYKGLDSHRSRQREAALEKFRLKRKDRCYEKKVRYQSRKRLAEQRPRVKGQFVRQQPSDPPISEAGYQ